MTQREKIACYLVDASRRGFIWGENDCALFSNNMLVKVFGAPDFGAELRGKYSNYKDAMLALKSIGFKRLQDMPQKYLKQIHTPQFGAVVLAPNNRSLGVCFGSVSYFINRMDGLTVVKSSLCKKFWKY